NVFPKNDDFCVEQFVERDTPCAFCSPQRSAQANQPRTGGSGACFAILHRTPCNVGVLMRQRDQSTSVTLHDCSIALVVVVLVLVLDRMRIFEDEQEDENV